MGLDATKFSPLSVNVDMEHPMKDASARSKPLNISCFKLINRKCQRDEKRIFVLKLLQEKSTARGKMPEQHIRETRSHALCDYKRKERYNQIRMGISNRDNPEEHKTRKERGDIDGTIMKPRGHVFSWTEVSQSPFL